ncbi:hypothetical protein L6164_005770 [Bauhinia variegata]|uniref:Uncharacterized protein n=1 Tax=Bauhinia variegata TaxID=167791 RepID=A0ACB9PSC0_BAUVA|nr:hypothetical protein L6164_005770 [Bauhinia variegata]
MGNSSTSASDKSSLLAIKSSMNLNTHELLAKNWSRSSPFCHWIGITCDARHERVMALNLSNVGLTGYMAPELGNFSYLTELDLSNNNFHGKIPNDLRGLHRLKLLNLSYNGLSGDIPPWIGDLSELQYLGLQSSSFAGSIPIEVGQLHQLKTSDIAMNELSGRIPVEVFNISSLEVLILASNSFSGEISKAIGDLPNSES